MLPGSKYQVYFWMYNYQIIVTVVVLKVLHYKFNEIEQESLFFWFWTSIYLTGRKSFLIPVDLMTEVFASRNEYHMLSLWFYSY